MSEQNIELISSGIKCDAEGCGWRDDDVKPEDYIRWVNTPCPKCGSNLLTEDDFVAAKSMEALASLINTLPPEEIDRLSQFVDIEEIKKSPMFNQAKGLENLDSEGKVSMTMNTHNGLHVTEIKKSE